MDVAEPMDVDDPEFDSLASTPIETYDSEEEWEVQDILAERFVNGENRYLIAWVGFPLYDASWEPVEHLGESTLVDWEATKVQQGHRQKENERIEIWRRAVRERLISMTARKEERNRKRIERGIDPTELSYSLKELLEDLANVPDDRDDYEVESPGYVTSSPENQDLRSPASSRKPSLNNLDLPLETPADAQPQKAPKKPSPASSSRRQSLTLPATQTITPRTSSKTGLSAKLGANKVRKTSTEIIPPRPVVQQAPVDTTNVFVGGKRRKKNPTLLDVASDPTKEPKLLKHRLSRLIQQASRNKEGVNPPAKKPSLMSLDPRERDGWLIGEMGSSHKTTSASVVENGHAHSPQQGLTGDSEKPLKPLKKKKSVGFVLEPESIEPGPEASLFLDDGNPPPGAEDYMEHEVSEQSSTLFAISKAAPAPILKSSLAEASRQPGSVTKDAKLFPGATTTVSLTLKLFGHLVPHWLSRLESEETLVFSHTCTGNDFRQHFQTQQLFRGTMTSTQDMEKLENTAARLRLGSFALMCHLDDFCILVHAGNCEIWERDSQVKEDAVLKFVMMDTVETIRRCDLAPYSFQPDIGHQDLPPGAFPAVFSRVLGFEYSRLLPSNLQNTTNHPFFLAFPVGPAEEEAKFVGQWLRSCNPSCKIQSSLHVGHWPFFIDHDQGVVIIHEDAAWCIRSFFNISRLLKNTPDNFTFWLFERSLTPRPLFPRPDDAIADIGDIRLQPVFDHGVAVLLTPSFFVTRPSHALTFMKWFEETRGNDVHPLQRPRFVVCGDIVEWLLDLALERRERSNRASGASKVYIDKEADAGFTTWNLARRIAEDAEPGGPESESFIYASKSIDGNDEQSLVNWFGWWSIMNMSRFREFIILGSDNPHAKSLGRQFRCPKFSSATVLDPDEVYRKLHKEEDQKQFSNGNAPEPTGGFQIVPNDWPSTLTNHFDRLIKMIRKACPVVVYKFPVSYWNSDMSFRFRDYKSEFSTYQKCFNWFTAFRSLPLHHNTYAAFFYTIEGEWDNRTYPQGVIPPRRPWIVLHRPVAVHKKPWTASELLIWDLTPNENLSHNKFAYEGDLIPAQRECIRIFSEENDTKNPGQPVKRVWFGGFEASWNGYTSQLDATLESMDMFTEDTRQFVPVPDQFLQERGWRMVKSGNAPPNLEPSPLPVEAMDVDEQQQPPPIQVDDSDAKIVFHPPRGRTGRPTKCLNHLYKATRGFLRDKTRMPGHIMDFTFRPTLEWYNEQMAEGRGFEHISVAPYGEIARRFGIPRSHF